MARIPLRVRLTVAFATALMLVMALAATFVYLRVRDDLNEALDENLQSRADDVASVAVTAGQGPLDLEAQRIVEREDAFAQILRTSGGPAGEVTPQDRQVLASSLPEGTGPVLSAEEAERAAVQPTFLDERGVPSIAGEARILARPVTASDRVVIVVVGSTTEDRDETLAGLGTTFLIGAPVAAILISGLGYLLAGLAVAPVAAALQREREFVGDASHELRTPLAILRTELELADREGRSTEDLRGALQSAGEEVDRLSQLAEDLLVLARSDQGRLPLRREPVALKVLLERVRSRFERRAQDAGRELSVEAPADVGASLDPLRLEQALGNLVDNALRHGGGEIRVAAGRNGERAEFTVSDEGQGFPAEFRAQAFERFTRADEGRTGGGSGLGLAIVRAIAEAHQGEAMIEAGPPTVVRLSVRA